MKKLFTILTVVALTTTMAFAQLSVKAGLNMANIISNVDDTDNGMKLGMIIGGNYSMELSDAMNLDVSVAFKQSGTKETEDFTGGSSTMTYSLNYLDISPSLSFNLSDAMALSLGPYLAFAMSGKVTGETIITNGPTTSTSESIEFGEATLEGAINGTGPDGISAMDFGINIGASFSINDAMSVSAGYALGLTDLYSVDSDLEELAKLLGDEVPSMKNSGIFLTFGYTFGGGY
jgi:long-subunit fatty acid transport protein